MFAVLCFGSKCKSDEPTQIQTDEARMEENNCKTVPKGLEQAKEGYYPIAKRSKIVLALKEKGVELGAEFVLFVSKQKTKHGKQHAKRSV